MSSYETAAPQTSSVEESSTPTHVSSTDKATSNDNKLTNTNEELTSNNNELMSNELTIKDSSNALPVAHEANREAIRAATLIETASQTSGDDTQTETLAEDNSEDKDNNEDERLLERSLVESESSAIAGFDVATFDATNPAASTLEANLIKPPVKSSDAAKSKLAKSKNVKKQQVKKHKLKESPAKKQHAQAEHQTKKRAAKTMLKSGKAKRAPLLLGKLRDLSKSQKDSAVWVRATKRGGSLPLFNRELSWLEFNARVLEEALDQTQPLLERLKFLAIFSTNLDEFFMIRVSGLKQQEEENVAQLSPDGLTAAAQLEAINSGLRSLLAAHARCLATEILPSLAAEGIRLIPYRDLTEHQRTAIDDYFMQHVFPVLTPQAVDPSHRFPYISNLSLNLGVMVEPSEDHPDGNDNGLDDDEPRFARVKVPPVVPRLVPITKETGKDSARESGKESSRFVLLEEIIAANIGTLFPGVRVSRPSVFRVTRDADIEIEEDEADDLLRMMERELRKRRFGMAVRLEVAADMPQAMREYLARSLHVPVAEVYVVEGVPLATPDLMALYKLDKPKLKDQPLTPLVPEAFTTNDSVFDAIKRRDILLHHPFDSFEPVVNFIRRAANDPDVLAIKMTLYRTGQPSPIVQALMEASERGKQVAVLVELKARFDEENNIEWARKLDQAGVHVVYGLLGLKTHSKLALVVRREGVDGLRRYCHIGTGNYNPSTAKLYTDIGLFTADEAIGADATELFNYLTGYSQQRDYRRLLVAPAQMRNRLAQLVRREIKHQKSGKTGRIVIKMNSLTDEKMIRLLYLASQAGVQVDLIIRGICMLKPGIKGLSETITVTSIVGRFLEHSRIFYFGNNGNETILIGSADWMRRNLERRVELIVPVTDALLKTRLREILEIYLRDNAKARRLQPDGTYTRLQTLLSSTEKSDESSEAKSPPAFDAQKFLTPSATVAVNV